MSIVIIFHNVEARSIEEIRERHRSKEAEVRLDEGTEAVDDPAGELEEHEPQTPADD